MRHKVSVFFQFYYQEAGFGSVGGCRLLGHIKGRNDRANKGGKTPLIKNLIPSIMKKKKGHLAALEGEACFCS